MQIINSKILNNNEFYLSTINYIFYSPDAFISNTYIKDMNLKLENKLLLDDLESNEIIYIKFIIGLCKYKLNDYFSAINIFEDLSNNESLNSDHKIKGYLYTILSISYLKLNNIDKHIKYFNTILKYLKRKNMNDLLLYLYLNTSLNKLEMYTMDEILYSNINNSFNILIEYDGIYHSQSFLILGIIYYKYLNLYSIAIELFEKALSNCKVHNNTNLKILIMYNIGCTYLFMSQKHKGISILKNILNHYNDDLPVILRLNIYSHIVECFCNSKENLNDAKKLLELYKENLYKLDSFYIDIYLARYNLLIVYYKIIENKNSYNHKSLLELFCYLDNASYIYKSNFNKFTFMEFEYWIEISYGNLYFALSNYEKALLHHKKALLFSEKPQNENNIKLYRLISEDYENLFNYKESLKYYKESVKILESNNNYNNYPLYINLFEDFNNKITSNLVNNNFFSNLSHELKTPVNIIYSSIQLMGAIKNRDSQSLTEYFNKYEKSIKQNCLRMLKLINNLIDITKIDSGLAKLDLVVLDVIPFIEDLTLSLIPYTRYKNLNITFDTDIEKHYLKVDIQALERILLNILSNAIKFNKKNGDIVVSTSTCEKNLYISIKDTGIGIPNSLQDSIFNRFYKVDTSLSRNTEGSGIGLTIAKALIEMHGGKIELNTEYTNGCEFVISLPNNFKNGFIRENQYNYIVDDEKILRELSDIYELF